MGTKISYKIKLVILNEVQLFDPVKIRRDKMIELTGKYKCGCNWATVFVKGASKREQNIEMAKRKTQLCPKCQDKIVKFNGEAK